MYPFTWSPSAVPARRWARSISPVAIAGMRYISIRWALCVPFPAPGAPKMIRFIGSGSDLTSLLDEPLVLTHDQLRLDLFHGIQGHADDDQDRRSPQVHVLRWYSGERRREEWDEHGHPAQEERPGERDAGHRPVKVLCGRNPRPNPGDEGRVLLEIVRGIDRVEGHRRIEVGESEDQDEVHEVIEDVGRNIGAGRHPVGPQGPRDLAPGGGCGRKEVADDDREEHDRNGEDDRDNARLVHPERQVRAAPLVDLAAYHPLRRLDRDLPLRLLNLDDEGGDHDGKRSEKK